MDQLINETAYGPGSERFATVEAQVSGLQKLYSLAQCIPDRGGLLCERCLRKALRNIDLCCNEFADMAFFYPSCQLRYSVLAPFYEFSSSPPPAVASPGPPPPPANESSTPLECQRNLNSINITGHLKFYSPVKHVMTQLQENTKTYLNFVWLSRCCCWGFK
ncbi:hypothetical protein V2J09_005091 [Rumex salicifolius]